MDNKQIIINAIHTYCKEKEITEQECFTASFLSEFFDISRNTVSQYLNEGVKEGSIVKVNTRPVYFYSKSAIESLWNIKLDKNVYASFSDLLAQKRQTFQRVIGYNGSLSSVVEQSKAAIRYPGNGLPILFYGPTGTGKTMLAQVMYDYARNHEMIQAEGRMISVNCSEYANNPELLTANLFGYVKGAYTGADDNHDGLISLANNGVLFLDEVHCLKAECQEKLFQFMDTGKYHRLGDNDKWYESNCRLIFATTENPQTVILKTLLRRIPIIVTVPSLKERPLFEKRQLLYSILLDESKKIGKEICISNLAYSVIMEHEFKANIGEMKNNLKATVAKVFLKDEDVIRIRLLDLPGYFFDSIQAVHFRNQDSSMERLLTLEDLKQDPHYNIPLIDLYDQMIKIQQVETADDEEIATRLRFTIHNFLNSLFAQDADSNEFGNEDYLVKMVDKIFSLEMNRYNVVIANSTIKMYARFFLYYEKNTLDTKIWANQHEKDIREIARFAKYYNPQAYSLAEEIVQNALLNLDIAMDEMVKVILSIGVMEKNDTSSTAISGLILCHGYSTASSIADTANRMLGHHIFDGIDMEIEISIDKIIQLVNNYLKRKPTIKELLLLVDMGSLEEIDAKIQPMSDCNIGMISHVSTVTALEAGNCMMQGKSIRDILKHMKGNTEFHYHYIEGRGKQDVILTLCATGFGTAKKFSELIMKSMPREIDLKIMPYDYDSLVSHKEADSIFDNYNIKLMIGTLDPKIPDIPYIPVENIIANEDVESFIELISKYLSKEELDRFNANIMKNFTLSNLVNNLTILNAEKVINDVEQVVQSIENALEIQIDTTTKIGLYIHLSCLIERLMMKQEITYAEGVEEFIRSHTREVHAIRESFSVVEEKYSVEVPDPEIMYIWNYVQIA